MPIARQVVRSRSIVLYLQHTRNVTSRRSLVRSWMIYKLRSMCDNSERMNMFNCVQCRRKSILHSRLRAGAYVQSMWWVNGYRYVYIIYRYTIWYTIIQGWSHSKLVVGASLLEHGTGNWSPSKNIGLVTMRLPDVLSYLGNSYNTFFKIFITCNVYSREKLLWWKKTDFHSFMKILVCVSG